MVHSVCAGEQQQYDAAMTVPHCNAAFVTYVDLAVLRLCNNSRLPSVRSHCLDRMAQYGTSHIRV